MLRVCTIILEIIGSSLWCHGLESLVGGEAGKNPRNEVSAREWRPIKSGNIWPPQLKDAGSPKEPEKGTGELGTGRKNEGSGDRE